MIEKFRDAFLKAIFCLFVLLLIALKPHLLPHDDIEALAGLIGEHDAQVVVISVGVHIKCHTEVYRAELVVSCYNKCISVL